MPSDMNEFLNSEDAKQTLDENKGKLDNKMFHTMLNLPEYTYIGDGIYARFAHWQIALTTHPSRGDEIYLEYETFLSLCELGRKYYAGDAED